ncbi:hypothetical protein GGR57DRAFT_496832 [Xylariaceae sp. FL1272]|nr:hypothetical protein GGR57DRAFT_496832 [Xylariaceae sp. FL1272]
MVSSQNSRNPWKAAQRQRTTNRNMERGTREMQLSDDCAEYYSDGDPVEVVVIGRNRSNSQPQDNSQMQSTSDDNGRGKERAAADHQPLEANTLRNTEGSGLSMSPHHCRKAPAEQRIRHHRQTRGIPTANSFAAFTNLPNDMPNEVAADVSVGNTAEDMPESAKSSPISEDSGLVIDDHQPLETGSPRRITASPENLERASEPEFDWNREYRALLDDSWSDIDSVEARRASEPDFDWNFEYGALLEDSWPEIETVETRLRRALASAGFYGAPGDRSYHGQCFYAMISLRLYQTAAWKRHGPILR